jgi:hypothetical protein
MLDIKNYKNMLVGWFRGASASKAVCACQKYVIMTANHMKTGIQTNYMWCVGC